MKSEGDGKNKFVVFVNDIKDEAYIVHIANFASYNSNVKLF